MRPAAPLRGQHQPILTPSSARGERTSEFKQIQALPLSLRGRARGACGRQAPDARGGGWVAQPRGRCPAPLVTLLIGGNRVQLAVGAWIGGQRPEARRRNVSRGGSGGRAVEDGSGLSRPHTPWMACREPRQAQGEMQRHRGPPRQEELTVCKVRRRRGGRRHRHTQEDSRHEGPRALPGHIGSLMSLGVGGGAASEQARGLGHSRCAARHKHAIRKSAFSAFPRCLGRSLFTACHLHEPHPRATVQLCNLAQPSAPNCVFAMLACTACSPAGSQPCPIWRLTGDAGSPACRQEASRPADFELALLFAPPPLCRDRTHAPRPAAGSAARQRSPSGVTAPQPPCSHAIQPRGLTSRSLRTGEARAAIQYSPASAPRPGYAHRRRARKQPTPAAAPACRPPPPLPPLASTPSAPAMPG